MKKLHNFKNNFINKLTKQKVIQHIQENYMTIF
jgi:hypothetical protein